MRHLAFLIVLLLVAHASSVVFASNQSNPPAGIVSWWPGEGNANDVVGSNNGTLHGGTGFTAGKVGQAFLFHGLGDFVAAATNNLPTGNSDRTLELWARIDKAETAWTRFAVYGNFTYDQEYELGAHDAVPYFTQWGTGAGGSSAMKLGVWYHIAVTNVGDLATLYMNGVVVASAKVPINTAAYSQFFIGAGGDTDGGIVRFNGAVDEVRIYNRALSASEIQAIYGGKPPTIAFSDVSQSSGIANQNVSTNAVQWIDYNDDGRLDLFLVGSNGTALFKNLGNGKFVDVTTKVRIGNNGRDSRGASWADIDNDGHPDVFIANATGPPTLLLNKKTTFKDVSNSIHSIASPGGTTRAGIWLDVNNDGLIDLFLINDGAPNQLLKNTGATHFTDIAKKAGVAFAGAGRSAVSADFDGDGLLDIYLANFNQPNKFYINNGDETFRETGTAAGVAFSGASVQAAITDFNGDQKTDLFVVNSNAPSFFFKNLGGLKFKKIASASLRKSKNGVAAAFGDFDLDGDEDLVLSQSIGGNFLFTNDGKGKFQLARDVSFNHTPYTTGIAVGDCDNDGAPDIAIADSLFMNVGSTGNNFLTLILQGKQSNRSAIGAQVLLQTGSIFQVKVVSGGDGMSQGSLPLVFGVGKAADIDSVRVVWPSGINQVLQHVKANQILKVTEPNQ